MTEPRNSRCDRTTVCVLGRGHSGSCYRAGGVRVVTTSDGHCPRRDDSWIISCGCEESLTIAEIWPDGNAPENPTTADVIAEIRKSGNPRTFARNWNMEPEGVEVNGVNVDFR